MSLLRTCSTVVRCGLVLVGPLCVSLLLPIQARSEDKAGAAPRTDAKVAVPEGVRYHADLTYHTVGETQLKLDLARPAVGQGPFPGVIVLNGGCWLERPGSRKGCTSLLLRLAEQGCVAVVISHRSAANHPFPAQIHDVKAAVRWLRGQAGAGGVDPDRIGVVGFSSGGHLACLLGCTTPADGLEGPDVGPRVSSQVQVVVACYAPTDLARLRQNAEAGKPNWLQSQTALSVLNRLLPRETGVDWTTKASPIRYARRDMAPLLLIHGSADTIVPCEQSERYADKLKAAGASVRLLKLEGAGHDFGSGFGGRLGKQSDDATVAFLLQHFQGRASSK